MVLTKQCSLDLPSNQFIDPKWNADPSVITLLYKHKSKPGKIFTLVVSCSYFVQRQSYSIIVSMVISVSELQALPIDQTVVITLSQRNGDTYNLELDGAHYWESSSTNSSFVSKLKNIDVSSSNKMTTLWLLLVIFTL